MTIYPVGIQDFESLRHDGYAYVDKTALIHRLITRGRHYFLSRPRRFGKSLLISTLKAYFEGKRELFKGLAIDGLTDEWTPRPVLHIDLNTKSYDRPDALQEILADHLKDWEAEYGVDDIATSVERRFVNVIRKAHAAKGHRVAILVDEYDKPMVLNIAHPELQEAFRRQLKAFYGVLKSEDAHIRFALLTGVTKFTKVSVFSDLNNLNDISSDACYDAICGLTEQEIRDNFAEGVRELAAANKQTEAECYAELKKRYDGYHFGRDCVGVYNPYSMVKTLEKNQYNDYWFESGTPTILVEVLKETGFDLQCLAAGDVDGDVLGSIETMHRNPLPLIFQTGYLTIKGYNEEFDEYRLGFPNEEVERGFVKFLLPIYAQQGDAPFSIIRFVKDVRAGKPEDFMRRMQAMTVDTSYQIVGDAELYYQNVLFLFFRLLGFYVEVEHPTSDGRMDMVVKTADSIYVFEFKLAKSADAAIQQINDKGYADAYAADPRTVYKIGANFSPETRRIDDWRVERA